MYRWVPSLRKTLIMIVILAFAVLQPCLSPLADSEAVEPSIRCAHRVELIEGGLLLVNDTFSFSSPNNSSVSDVREFFVGYPRLFSQRMDYHAVYTSMNGTWTVPGNAQIWLEEGMTGLRISFPDPAMLGQNMTLVINTVFVFSELFIVTSQEMLVPVPLFPATSGHLSSCVTEVRLPSGATLRAVSPNVLEGSIVDGIWVLRNETLSLPKYQNVSAIVDYYVGSSSAFLYDVEKIERRVDLGSPSVVKIQDSFTLRNLGASVTYYGVRLPLQASDVHTRDSIGATELYLEKKENVTYQSAYIWPRTSIKQGERWKFTVEYSLPSVGLLGSEANEYTLRAPALPDVNYTVRALIVTIALPEGAEPTTSTPKKQEVERTGPFSWELVYTAKNVTFLQHLSLEASYVYSPIWLAFRPTILAVVASALMAVVIGYTRRKKATSEHRAALEPSLLGRLVDLYEQRLSMDNQSDQLEEELENRRISRAEYSRRKDASKNRELDIENQIKSVKERLTQEWPSIEASLHEIEVSEIEVQTERNNLRELEARLRNRGVARDAYNRLRQEYLNRIRRARSRIQRTVLSLREKTY